MIHHLITLEDETEIVFTDIRPDGTILVYVEKPDEADGFHHASYILPNFCWRDVYGFTDEELDFYTRVIQYPMRDLLRLCSTQETNANDKVNKSTDSES